MTKKTVRHILLVEDEVHKRDELSVYLDEFIVVEKAIDVVQSVREAVVAVENKNYDLVILDMALPTFTVSEEVLDGGLDQALGGVEVLRTLKTLGQRIKVIIVTQYPDIALDGRRVKLKAAQAALSKKYNQDIKGAVAYKYKSSANRTKMKNILDRIW
ncbi:response regulator [Sulfitobacter geojensis]|uniref:Response regulator n=1 Tax=Sulfitobacter geojensis TaxID=1342299 RepID=A0AAE2W075_9RHOB|nr:response regulator [Sulfitobacter geojensis]MBM1690783.1 response regulator [Sulfitobacter geojensis]MBM1694849.1 response regulator [Sulfitobacter geojensis]MBM1706997.1 response regulator [Sulfitobacter geojensis]MBM1711055.1 response regulator [Sulfitobacter geojensis]MBM1715121.1 response regulator [Sulfitobacter geojensis]